MKTFDEQTTLRLFQTACVLKPQQKRNKELFVLEKTPELQLFDTSFRPSIGSSTRVGIQELGL